MPSLCIHSLTRLRPVLLAVLLGGMLYSPGMLRAQGTDAVKDSSLYQQIEQYKEEAQSLVYFIEYMFNVLGDDQASTSEKDIIIQESFLKVFRDAKVQVEDDLVPNRKVVTNKDVPAYLKDITFFFKEVNFEFTIEQVSHQVSEDNKLFFLVSYTRVLKGINVEGDTVNSLLPRYMEINLDEEEKLLKVVSMYTTKMSEQEELANWWNQMPMEWKSLFAGNVQVTEVMTMEEVLEMDNASGVYDTLMLNSADSLAQQDTMVLANPLIFSSLRKIVNLEEIDLSNKAGLRNLEPLSKLSQLRHLDISHTQITDLSPLRNLTYLETLDCSYGAITDFSALKYAVNLKELNCSNSQLKNLSSLQNFSKLQKLNIHHTQVSDLKPLSKLKNLRDLRISHTSVSDIQALQDISRLSTLYLDHTEVEDISSLNQLSKLEYLQIDNTRVNTLSLLTGLSNLRFLSANNTKISNLDPLGGLKSLQWIYCDNTMVTREEATRFMTLNPEVLVIFQSTALQRWWDSLGTDWKLILDTYATLDEKPSKEQLQILVNIDTLDLGGHIEINTLNPLKEFRSLKVLYCQETSISSLSPIRGLFDLEYLNCSYTKVNSLAPLSDLKHLKFLLCSHTSIGNLDALKEMAYLEEANFDSSPVKRLDPVAGLVRLKRLYVDSTGVDEVQATKMMRDNPHCLVIFRTEGLRQWWADLDAAWRAVFRLHVPTAEPPDREALHKMTSLKEIDIQDQSEIRDLSPLQLQLQPTSLTLINTRVISLAPLSMLTSLEKLDVSKNAISDLGPVRNLFSLKMLECSNTPVEDLKPLELLVSLEVIKVSGTQVKDLKPLKGLTYLKRLDCSNTRVKSINHLGALHHLNSLKCYNTRIPAVKIQKFKKENPDIDVIFY